ncbi:MAG: oligosaccharide flippase family protein [Alphaproteobacteria bacterium]
MGQRMLQSSTVAVTKSEPGRRSSGLGWLGRWMRDGLLRRVFKNAGVLLSGKAVGALFGLGALALTARGLGPEMFGVLMLINEYARAIGEIAKFQSWQAVIRYGAVCLENDRRDDFHDLVTFTVLLDVGSAVVGAAAAAAAVTVVGPWFGLPDEVLTQAAIYGAVNLFMISATPSGLLRLFDRFDLLAAQSSVTPVVRLLGAVAAFSLDAEFWVYLLVWASGTAASGLSFVFLAWRELRRRDLLRGYKFRIRGIAKPHKGIWSFVWSTNLYGSLGTVVGRLTTLIIGAVLGPAGAGLYKIAAQFARGMIYPAGLLKRALYPELSKLQGRGETKSMRRVVVRSAVLAGSITSLGIPIVIFFGEWILQVTVGDQYLGAASVLVLLTVGIAVRAFGFPLDSTLFALGRPGVALKVRAAVTLIYFPALIMLLQRHGLVGAGFVEIIAAILTVTTLVFITLRRLAKDITRQKLAKKVAGPAA